MYIWNLAGGNYYSVKSKANSFSSGGTNSSVAVVVGTVTVSCHFSYQLYTIFMLFFLEYHSVSSGICYSFSSVVSHCCIWIELQWVGGSSSSSVLVAVFLCTYYMVHVVHMKIALSGKAVPMFLWTWTLLCETSFLCTTLSLLVSTIKRDKILCLLYSICVRLAYHS